MKVNVRMVAIGATLIGALVLSGCGNPTPANNGSAGPVGPANTPGPVNTSGPANSSDSGGQADSQTGTNSGPLSFYFHVWKLGIQPVVITTDNYSTNTRTTTVGGGVSLPGSLRINPDGTYDWNSSWAGRIIHGKWTVSGDSEYPITLLNGEDNHDWKVGPSTDGKSLLLWDKQASIWKYGAIIK